MRLLLHDAESQAWVDALRSDGPAQAEAVERLRELLLRAARFEIERRRHAFPHVRGGDWGDLAHQCANDALLGILRKLDQFRGASRFTTWAYKFALLEAAVKLRRLAWQGRELPLTDDGWEVLAPTSRGTPEQQSENAELIGAVRDAITGELTPHQREVLVAITLNGVPIDVLAERLDTTRGALYKTLHDARRKLRACLMQRGFDIEGAING